MTRSGAALSVIGLSALLTGAPGDAGTPAARASVVPCAVPQSTLSAAALRGKRIFQRGVTADGRAVEGAIVGGEATLSGREAACASCHAPGGEGTEEGGIVAPPITPERLSSPTRERGAHTATTLAAAIREGRASSRSLDPVMPRYHLSDSDLADLIAYLDHVGRDPDPGVTESAVKLGAALPLTGPAAPVGTAVRDVLSAVFAEVNLQGGVYRRRIELTVEDSGGSAGEAGATTRLLDGGVLALVGSAWSDDANLKARLAEERAPLLGPLGAATATADGVIFRVQPGPDVLARVAILHLSGAGPSAGGTALIVHTRDGAGEAWASGARAEAARLGLPAPASVAFDPGHLEPAAIARAARQQRARAILFWGPGEDLGRCAARCPAPGGTSIYAPLGSMEGEEDKLRKQISNRVLFVYPGLFGDEARSSSEVLRAFLRRAGITPGPLSAQASAYVSARILIEALKRAGAHVTREGVITALEGLRDFDAGPAPLVSFARNRRVGVFGASLVRLDPNSGAAVRVSEWIEVVP